MTEPDGIVIDPAAQARLQEWGGPKLLTQMIKLFLENAPVRIEQVKKGLADGSLKDAERGVHSLKSSAANVGAVQLSKLAAQMESLAAGGDGAGVAQHVPRLEAAWAAAQPKLAATLAAAAEGAE
jgi:HPt (histidine-containing phosphotransfer) domain-containing protein